MFPWPTPAPGVWNRAGSRLHSTLPLHFCILLCLTFISPDICPHHPAAGEAVDQPLPVRAANARVSNSIPTERYMTYQALCGQGGPPNVVDPARRTDIVCTPLYTSPISLQWPTGHVLPPNTLESGRGRSGRFTHITRTAYRPISAPIPLLTQPGPDDHVPETSRHVHGSSSLVLCQAYTI